MRASLQSDALIRAVRVADLRSYLLSKGWQPKPFKRSQVLYFEGPPDDEGKPLVQLVPATEQLRDYGERVENILAALSTIEERPADEILRNIVSPTCDIFHVRLDSPATRIGTLELGFVEKFFANVRNLLVFAACGELRPQRYFQRALKDAARFADRCQLRPASAGSFRVDVESPLAPPAMPAQVQLKAYPSERLILLSLMEGLDFLRQSIESGNTEVLFQPSARHLNANMCEALLGMKPASSGVKLELGVSWSTTWPLEARFSQKVVFEDRGFEWIDAIARILRSGNEPQQKKLRGRVVRLSAENPLSAQTGALVIVMNVESPNAPSHVEIILTSEQYRQACYAHLEGRPLVVYGTLAKMGRRWLLMDVTDFQAAQTETIL